MPVSWHGWTRTTPPCWAATTPRWPKRSPAAARTRPAIIARDPLEHGERALLNFGHTFGHAIEAEQGYAEGLNHGEAVAVGMLLAARLSAALGLASWADAEALRALLLRFGLPVDVPAGLAPEALLARMRLDKKVQASGLRFILWDRPGARADRRRRGRGRGAGGAARRQLTPARLTAPAAAPTARSCCRPGRSPSRICRARSLRACRAPRSLPRATPPAATRDRRPGN